MWIPSLPSSWDMFIWSVNLKLDLGDQSTLANQVSHLCTQMMVEFKVQQNTWNSYNNTFFCISKPAINRFLQTTLNMHTNGKLPNKSTVTGHNCGKTSHRAVGRHRPCGSTYTHQLKKGGWKCTKQNIEGQPKNSNACTHIAISNEAGAQGFALSTLDHMICLMGKSADMWIVDGGSSTHKAKIWSPFTDYQKVDNFMTGVAGKETILSQGTVELWCNSGPNLKGY